MPEAIIARPSEKIAAKIKTSFVVAECGSRSSGVKNQAKEKNVVTLAVSSAKVIEITKRDLDLSNAVAITSRPSVGGIQFHKMILARRSLREARDKARQ
jgi:hypothetical protein